MSESVLSLVVDTSGVKSGVNAADSLLIGLNKTAIVVAGTVTAVGAALAAFSYKAVQTYAVQEESELQLAAAIRATGEDAEGAVKSLSSYASEIQRLTTYGDEMIISQMAQLKNFGVQTSQLKDASKAAVGLAAKYRIDLTSAIELIGKASQGQTQTLARYGIILGENLSTQEKFNTLLTIGANSFGLAEENAKTFTGRLTQMYNSFGDALEPFGMMIMDGLRLKDVMAFVTESISSVTNQIQNLSPYLLQMISDTLGVGNVFEYVSNILRTYVIPYIGDVLVVSVGYATAAINLFRVNWNVVSIAIRSSVLFVVESFNLLVKSMVKIGQQFDATKEMANSLDSAFTGIKDSLKTGIVEDAGDIANGILGIGKSAEWAGKLITNDLTSPLSDLGGMDGGATIGAATTSKAQEQRFAGLALQGSVDAYKAEIARVGVDDQIASNTQKTAQNTARIARAMERDAGFALGSV